MHSSCAWTGDGNKLAKLLTALCCAALAVTMIQPLQAQEDSPVPSGSIAPSPVQTARPQGLDRMLDGLVRVPADVAERIIFFPAGTAFSDYPVLATPWVL